MKMGLSFVFLSLVLGTAFSSSSSSDSSDSSDSSENGAPATISINGYDLTITTCTMRAGEVFENTVINPGPIKYVYKKFEESDCDNGLPPDSTNNDDITCMAGITSIDPFCENSGIYLTGTTNNVPTPGLQLDGPAAYFRCENDRFDELVDPNDVFWSIQYICGDTDTFFNGAITSEVDNVSQLQITSCFAVDRSGGVSPPAQDDDPWYYTVPDSSCINGPLDTDGDDLNCAFGFVRQFMGQPITENGFRILPPKNDNEFTFPTIEWFTNEELDGYTFFFGGFGVQGFCGDLEEFGLNRYYCSIDESNADFTSVDINGEEYLYQRFKKQDCMTSEENENGKPKGDCLGFIRSFRHCSNDFYGMRILYPGNDDRNGDGNDIPNGPGLIWKVNGGDCGDDPLLEVEYLCV